VVHVREVDGQRLTFIVSGKLWRNSMVMQDRETGTLWNHVTGEALDGPLAGEQLEMVPAVQTTWGAWRGEHPQTQALVKPAGLQASHYADYFADESRMGMFAVEWLQERMPGKTKIFGIKLGPETVALPVESLPVGSLKQLELDEEPLVIHHGPGGARAYLAKVGGRKRSFEKKGDEVRDRETGSTWDLGTGKAVGGPAKGAQLEEIVVHVAFWFAWSSFFPRTAVLD